MQSVGGVGQAARTSRWAAYLLVLLVGFTRQEEELGAFVQGVANLPSNIVAGFARRIESVRIVISEQEEPGTVQPINASFPGRQYQLLHWQLSTIWGDPIRDVDGKTVF